MNPECFNGIGKFKNYEHIKLKDNAKEIVHSFGKIALALRGKLEKGLQNVVNQGFIASVGNGVSDWVNSLVVR